MYYYHQSPNAEVIKPRHSYLALYYNFMTAIVKGFIRLTLLYPWSDRRWQPEPSWLCGADAEGSLLGDGTLRAGQLHPTSAIF
jgi:hypothetical protein